MEKLSIVKERQENYERARQDVVKYIGKDLTHDFIKRIHASIMGLDVPCGYRAGSGSCQVRNQRTSEVVFLSPDCVIIDIQKEMQKLLDWYAKNKSMLSVVEIAAFLHWAIVKIHPFSNGNGRTARLLVLFVLFNHGYSDSKGRTLEEYFETNRIAYDKALDDGKLMYVNFANFSAEWLAFVEEGLECC